MFWYNKEVEAFEGKTKLPKTEKPRLLLYGSSSFRLWSDAQNHFPEFEVINLGFGGSTLAACAWFFKRIVPIFNPDFLIVYAGDNDLGDGRTPEEVFFSFKGLMQLKEEFCGDMPTAFVSIKPSPSRQHILGSIKYANEIIEKEILAKHPDCAFIDIYNAMMADHRGGSSYYEHDGLHMSKKGYDLWTKVFQEKFLNHLLEKKL